MDYENGLVGFEDEYHLQKAARSGGPPNQVLPIILSQRKRRACVEDDFLGLFGFDAMRGDVLLIPGVPLEDQGMASGTIFII
jgi:hypothetical protein